MTVIIAVIGSCLLLFLWSNAELKSMLSKVNSLRVKGHIVIARPRKIPIHYRISKRLFDIVFSSFALILLTPVYWAVYVAIKLESEGPVAFARERIGLRGKPIKVLKFRTVYLSTDKQGSSFPRLSDIGVTKVGRFLRKTSLDEIPAFLNVLTGDMSLVGRSLILDHPESSSTLTSAEREALLDIKPGLVSLWALSRDVVDYNFENVLDFDKYYLTKMSFGFDLKAIIGATIVLFGSTSQY